MPYLKLAGRQVETTNGLMGTVLLRMKSHVVVFLSPSGIGALLPACRFQTLQNPRSCDLCTCAVTRSLLTKNTAADVKLCEMQKVEENQRNAVERVEALQRCGAVKSRWVGNRRQKQAKRFHKNKRQNQETTLRFNDCLHPDVLICHGPESSNACGSSGPVDDCSSSGPVDASGSSESVDAFGSSGPVNNFALLRPVDDFRLSKPGNGLNSCGLANPKHIIMLRKKYSTCAISIIKPQSLAYKTTSRIRIQIHVHYKG